MVNLLFAILSLSLLSSLVPLMWRRHTLLQRFSSFALLACSGIGSIIFGLWVISHGITNSITLPIGLPWLPWHLHYDSLSAFFFIILGIVTLAISIFGFGYCREYDDRPRSLLHLLSFTGFYVLGMQLVLVADDAFMFMIAWELMSLASYFLVAFNHHQGDTRRAAFLYLLMAQISGLSILLSFAVLADFGHDFSFTAMRAAELSPIWATIAFTFAFIGFGGKAGLVPLHAWLPQAHPVAPSHISALLSAVIVKIALYGFLRVVFDLIGTVQWQWGFAVLVVGAISALYGVLYALLQTDMKRLLAYSTVENMGIIFIAVGLALVFEGNGFKSLAALALVAALYHALNHACFKGLLFLGAGAVLHNTHEINMNRLGGLIHVMPWTALLFLFGCISISSLPPFNGFASEWLIFQSALQATVLDSGVMRASIPLAAGVLALTAGLSAACFVKIFGISFLGQARSKHAQHTHHDVPFSMRAGQFLLASLCLLLGLAPGAVVKLLSTLTTPLLGATLPDSKHTWLWLLPIPQTHASYSAPWVFAGILLALLCWFIVYLLLKTRRKTKPVPRVPIWDCGFGPLNARMQYSAESFSMPIQRIVRPLFDIEQKIEELPAVEDENLKHQYNHLQHTQVIRDILEQRIYQPIGKKVLQGAQQIGRLQTGYLKHYLGYSFITLLVLLWLLV